VDLEKKILERVKPTPAQCKAISDTAEKLKKKVEKYLKDKKLEVEVRFVGSVAKGTHLADPDLDLFLLFPSTVSREELEQVGLRTGEDTIGGEKMYAEHPYTRGLFEGLEVDMVPCFLLESSERLLSAVDRTPFHTEYVLSRINDEQRDEIRLLKAFMKGIDAYGAEPNTRGFSGYMCELLVIHFGSFLNVVRAAAEWKEGVSIAIEKKGPPMTGPLVVYDPVDSKRNVASAVHLDTFAMFIIACRSYLAEPSEKFFFPLERKPMTKTELTERANMHGSRLLTVTFKRPDANTDNIYSQIWKTEYALERKLNAYSFNVLRSVHDLTDKIVIIFEIERDILSKTFKHIGPPVWVKSSESFLNKWNGNEYGKPFIEEGQWTVIAERRHSTAEDMLYEEAALSGIGREIELETMKVFGHDATLEKAPARLLTELLDPMNTWNV